MGFGVYNDFQYSDYSRGEIGRSREQIARPKKKIRHEKYTDTYKQASNEFQSFVIAKR